MKKQLLKKLFAFIIVMFSVYFLSAQCASNEILMSIGGFKYGCTQKCVKLSQKDKYLKKGWAPFGCPVGGPAIAPASNKILSTLSHPQEVTPDIYEMTGRLLKTLSDAQMETGIHQLMWNAKDEKGSAVNAGIYFLKMNTSNRTETKKLVVPN